jgi:hypothetical protein
MSRRLLVPACLVFVTGIPIYCASCMAGFLTTSSPLLQSPLPGVWMPRADQRVFAIPAGFPHAIKRRAPG